jgi:predicted RNase H-like nuclease (RuvC/YqgF family)
MSASWHGSFGPSPEKVALEKAKKELADAEYERDIQQRETERAKRRERELRENYRSEMDSAQEQRSQLHAEIMELEETLSLFEQWLRARNLWDQANAWVQNELQGTPQGGVQ